jgi:uncharacterized NAD(P)/FAD-binding protein YdhS
MPVSKTTAPALPPALVDVAIVGTGFSGVACAVQCSWLLPVTAHVALIGADRPGRGAAYGTSSARLLMNGPARSMSALPQDELDLVKRLRVDEHALIPRRDYSAYLQTLLDEALGRHPGIAVYRDEVVDIARDGDAFLLSVTGGTMWRARSVVLALGNAAPASSFLPASLREHPGFVADPWSLEALPGGDVLCVGAGLTAMDVVALADARDDGARIHLLSRHGRLPEIEDPYARTLDATRFDLDGSSPRSVVRTVRAAIARYAVDGGDWRDVLESMRPVTQAIWSGWNLHERRRFLRHVGPIWSSHRYRVPPATFAAFSRMRDAGRVAVHRGHVAGAVALDNGSISIEIANGQRRITVAVSCAINCTGPDDDLERSPAPLVANLFRRGLARPDPMRMGFDAGDDLRLIDAEGRTGEIFALGPPLRGALYETTAVNEIREQALHIAKTLEVSW